MLGAVHVGTLRPFALDHRWSGLRRLSGHGGSRDRTTGLTLAFGEDGHATCNQPEMQVETTVPRLRSGRRFGHGGKDGRVHVGAGSRWTTSGDKPACYGTTFDSAVLSVGRRTDRGSNRRTGNACSLAVDGDPVEFAVLTEREHWVAHAIVDETVVGIQARNWKVDTTGLVTETNFAVYLEGSKEMRRRMTA